MYRTSLICGERNKTTNRLIKSGICYSFIMTSLSATFPAYSSLHIVTNINATGSGSLDAAVAAANADNSSSVQIGFDLPANSTISLQTPLFLQKSMIISTSTTFAPGASNLIITNPNYVVKYWSEGYFKQPMPMMHMHGKPMMDGIVMSGNMMQNRALIEDKGMLDNGT